ncbi:Uncharacterized protein conserved in bacteria [Haemophilus parahaemolyticus]|uniref:Uncharacterized protein conserved in bacteria n=1 Tax=Haemophilus parahaemolyticus TaxID=735 RepID=A0A377HZR9_HAEPH|nr:ATP-binding protein [Haemophilus parahaemolyticus]STO63237.1 Uncharacterized protein conserved in bacteria [Haemophilus parahaemolyticus]
MSEQQSLEFIAENNRAGFRLQRLEVFNWGTFHNKVWKVETNGQNGLLTGEVGSGKSTIVDAMTTLLVPSQHIAYNKAAGAESKERDLRSYVLGYYKSERDSETGVIKPAQLRDNNSYSVILGVFYNEGYDQYVSLAQVFWMDEQRNQPTRFYVGAEQDLSIAQDFANFGTKITALSKRLSQNGHEIFRTFPPYEAWFRRRFGIQNEQALELFHQTVSMKSVGNLTDFVRNHMLEPFAETEQRIANLISHFDDLNKAYQAVVKAEDQVKQLTPIVRDCLAYQEISKEIETLQNYIEHLPTYFFERKLHLLEMKLAELAQKLQLVQENIIKVENIKFEQEQEIDQLKWSINQNGGNRLVELEKQIKAKEQLKIEKQRGFEKYKSYIQALDEIIVQNSEDFIVQKHRLQQRQMTLSAEQSEQQNQEIEKGTALHQVAQNISELTTEIESLKQRESNIHRQQVEIRAKLCRALGLNEANFPFVGELLQIKESEKDGEGATERLLHNFALSLIVPEKEYARVAEWVNNNHLNGRLVYYLVNQNQAMNNNEIQPESLLHKILIKPETPYYQWVENELYKRFDYVACDSLSQFQREGRAITQKGQIKDKSGRHEKDDRHKVSDRSHYVLGWSNKEKIDALTKSLKPLTLQKTQIENEIIGLKQAQQQLKSQEEQLIRLERFASFSDIDFESIVKEIADLNREYTDLLASSNIIHQLEEKLQRLKQDLERTNHQYIQLNQQKGALEQEQENAKRSQELTAYLLTEQSISDELRKRLDRKLAEVLIKKSLTLENCENIEKILNKSFSDQKDKYNAQQKKANGEISRAMENFNKAYPFETSDFVANVESYLEYQAFLNRLNADDLPKFRTQFKKLLNENTINEIANFNAQLNRERETIKQRLGQINRSLEAIDYNPDRYIHLQSEPNPDLEIRQFQLDLRACTEGALTGSEDNQYSEAKFAQVKAIIDRFKGREHSAEADRRWTSKVTDVRNWFLFSASERWRADHSEHEYYPDSGGKSGGQKEKLAYTILAASLAYQFGLEFGKTRSRSFRFVMIDEAFGRGSDESAQYGLRLFKQLDLQLLIVTPLQKIKIIEPFVSSVAIVKNSDGAYSSLINLTIEEHLAMKENQE